MSEHHDAIHAQAMKAKARQDHLLHTKTLELTLHAMASNIGIKETRAILLRHCRHLREFHT